MCRTAASPSPLSILSCASARSPEVAISYNTCEAADDGRLFNTQAHYRSALFFLQTNHIILSVQVILRDGLVLTSYRKLHPWLPYQSSNACIVHFVDLVLRYTDCFDVPELQVFYLCHAIANFYTHSS